MATQHLKSFKVGWLLLLIVSTTSMSGDNSLQAQEQQEIITVIKTQLNAFKENDSITAFRQASPAIRRQLITADNYLEMVRFHYKAVFRPQQVTFLELESSEFYRIQHLMLIGPNGYSWDAYYVMERLSDGRWTIGGVHLVMRDELPV